MYLINAPFYPSTSKKQFPINCFCWDGRRDASPTLERLERKGGEVVGRLRGEHVIELARDRLHELAADGRGEGLEGRGVHAGRFDSKVFAASRS